MEIYSPLWLRCSPLRPYEMERYMVISMILATGKSCDTDHNKLCL